jgi:hypothetical protein
MTNEPEELEEDEEYDDGTAGHPPHVIAHVPVSYRMKVNVHIGSAPDGCCKHHLKLIMFKDCYLPFLPPVGLKIDFMDLIVGMPGSDKSDADDIFSLSPVRVKSVLWQEDEDDTFEMLRVKLSTSSIALPDGEWLREFFTTAEVFDWKIVEVRCMANVIEAMPWLKDWSEEEKGVNLVIVTTMKALQQFQSGKHKKGKKP